MLAALSQPTRQQRMRAVFCMVANAVDDCVTQSDLSVIFGTIATYHQHADMVLISEREISERIASLMTSVSPAAGSVSIENFEHWSGCSEALEWMDSYTTAIEQLFHDQGFVIDFVPPTNPELPPVPPDLTGGDGHGGGTGSRETEEAGIAPHSVPLLSVLLCNIFQLSTSRSELSREDTLNALRALPYREVFAQAAFEAAPQESTVPWW